MISHYSEPPLNENVLEEIFSIICDVSYPTLQSLLLTNRVFYILARPLLYRYIGINVANDAFLEEVNSWLGDSAKSPILKAIQHISIYSSYDEQGPNEKHSAYALKIVGGVQRTQQRYSPTLGTPPKVRDNDAEWAAVATLVSNTTQLRSVSFACHQAMPLVLIQSIHAYSNLIRLDLALWTRSAPGLSHDDPAELELLGSPSLRSLQADIYNPSYNPKDLRLHAFWRLVQSSPNLHTLMLRVGYGGCVLMEYSPEDERQWEILASHFERTTVRHGNSRGGIKNLRITGTDLSHFKDEELSKIACLDCPKFLPRMEVWSSLTSLTHLTLRSEYHHDSEKPIDALLIACPHLTSLSITGWSACLQLNTIFNRHGSSLRALALHEFETTDYSNPRPAMSPDNLLRIKDGCPHLEELSIDMNFPENPLPRSKALKANIHQEIYSALSSFPYLRRLQLNFNLGISTYNKQAFGRRPQLLPLADEVFVRSVWAAVNLPILEELRVTQGESGRHGGYGYPAGWVLWEEDTHRWFKATRPERDDEPEKLIISPYRDVPDFTEDVWRNCRW